MLQTQPTHALSLSNGGVSVSLHADVHSNGDDGVYSAGQGRTGKRAICLYVFPVVALLLYLFVRFYIGGDIMQGLMPL